MLLSLLAAAGEKTLLQTLGIHLWVLGTQVVIFVTTFILLSRILFGRTLGHLQQREEEIRKAQEAIQKDRAEVERMTKEYEAHLAKVDKEGYEKTQALLKEALSKAQASIGAAQADAKAQVENATREIAQEQKANMAKLRVEVARLTIEVAEKAMDTRLDPATHGAVVQKFIQGRS